MLKSKVKTDVAFISKLFIYTKPKSKAKVKTQQKYT